VSLTTPSSAEIKNDFPIFLLAVRRTSLRSVLLHYIVLCMSVYVVVGCFHLNLNSYKDFKCLHSLIFKFVHALSYFCSAKS
jgi:hypothetical protein